MKLFPSSLIIMSLLSPVAISTQGLALECLSAPERDDNSWQNWYVENKCSRIITLHYTEIDTKGNTHRGATSASPCKRTQIIQTFLNNTIKFDDEYTEPPGGGLCVNSKTTEPTQSERSAADISKRLQSRRMSGGPQADAPTQEEQFLRREQRQANQIDRALREERAACPTHQTECYQRCNGPSEYVNACSKLCQDAFNLCEAYASFGTPSYPGDDQISLLKERLNVDQMQVRNIRNRETIRRQLEQEGELMNTFSAVLNALAARTNTGQQTTSPSYRGGGRATNPAFNGGRQCNVPGCATR